MVQLDIFSLFVLFAAIMGVSVLAWAVPVRLWIEAMAAGVRIGIGYLVGMRLRKVSPRRRRSAADMGDQGRNPVERKRLGGSLPRWWTGGACGAGTDQCG